MLEPTAVGSKSPDTLGRMLSLARFAWLSVAAALVTMALKGVAAWLTGSLGLLSDALESFVNLGAALVALVSLRIAVREPDEKHPFGYTKAEYFSAAVEGGLIFVAAIAIVAAAVPRLIVPQPHQPFRHRHFHLARRGGGQPRHRASAAACRQAPRLDRAGSRRLSPAHRRVDLDRRGRGRGGHGAHRVARAGSADRDRGRGAHRLHRREGAAPLGARPDGPRAARARHGAHPRDPRALQNPRGWTTTLSGRGARDGCGSWTCTCWCPGR
jgi:hypothetical protein